MLRIASIQSLLSMYRNTSNERHVDQYLHFIASKVGICHEYKKAAYKCCFKVSTAAILCIFIYPLYLIVQLHRSQQLVRQKSID